MISTANYNYSDKIPSSLQLRFIEFIRTLDLNGKNVLELSNEPDGIGQELAECALSSAEISYIWNMPEKLYDIVILYSAICNVPVESIESIMERVSEVIKQKLVIVEDLPVDIFSEKELEVRKMIMPEHPGYLNGIIESKLIETGFTGIEKKIWASQIPLSEDEVARKIRILSRIAIEKRVDVSEELQELLAIYRIHKPIFTYKELITAYKS